MDSALFSNTARVDLAVHQHALSCIAVGPIGFFDLTAGEEKSVAAGQSDKVAVQAKQPRDETRDRGRMLRAGDADDRNASVLVGRKQVIDDRLTDWLARAIEGLDVHQQARAGIDFDDRALGLGERAGDVFGDEVDAGDVESDDTSGQRYGCGDIGVDFVGDVDGDVAVALDQHVLTGLGNRFRAQAAAGQIEHDGRIFIDEDAVEREVLGQAAARIGVELKIDQRAYRVLAVADDGGRFASGRRDHLAADHQKPVLVAVDAALDDHVAAFRVRPAHRRLRRLHGY